METPSEILWEVVEALLKGGNESLARKAFRWSAEYAFLCGLKNAPEPVVITKFEQDFLPRRFHLDSRLEQSWDLVATLYGQCKQQAAKARFVEDVDSCYRYAIKASRLGAREGGGGIWSVNKWH